MKKYWIIENGKPVGPFSVDDLRVRRDFTRDLPVWCAEFSDWTTAGEVAELACLIEEEVPVVSEEPKKVEEPKVEQRTPWIIATPPDEINGTKRPKSYMGWNIAMLLCCCLPMAVAGLIFGSQVNTKWMRGDVEGAVRASENAQWCIILSFVLGLLSWPFQMLFI